MVPPPASPPDPTAALQAATRALVAALAAPELARDAATVDALARYVAALARFGAHTDLVGARTPEGLAEIALADALVLARADARFVRAPAWEIGAGGASLTVPLALIVPALTGVLVEPRQKRATFLRLAVGTLGLAPRLRVEQSRVEPREVRAGAKLAGVAATALCRAVFPPEAWVPLAAGLLRERDGAVAVLTTEPLAPALAAALPGGLRVLDEARYELPYARVQRVATWLGR